MCTVTDQKTFDDLDLVHRREATLLKARNDSILLGNKTYSELFEKIIDNLTKNIFSRIEDGRISRTQPPKKDQNILFQFIGSLNLMHPLEMVRFKMLGNFLESEKSLEVLEKMLYIPKHLLQEKLVSLAEPVRNQREGHTARLLVFQRESAEVAEQAVERGERNDKPEPLEAVFAALQGVRQESPDRHAERRRRLRHSGLPARQLKRNHPLQPDPERATTSSPASAASKKEACRLRREPGQ